MSSFFFSFSCNLHHHLNLNLKNSAVLSNQVVAELLSSDPARIRQIVRHLDSGEEEEVGWTLPKPFPPPHLTECQDPLMFWLSREERTARNRLHPDPSFLEGEDDHDLDDLDEEELAFQPTLQELIEESLHEWAGHLTGISTVEALQAALEACTGHRTDLETLRYFTQGVQRGRRATRFAVEEDWVEIMWDISNLPEATRRLVLAVMTSPSLPPEIRDPLAPLAPCTTHMDFRPLYLALFGDNGVLLRQLLLGDPDLAARLFAQTDSSMVEYIVRMRRRACLQAVLDHPGYCGQAQNALPARCWPEMLAAPAGNWLLDQILAHRNFDPHRTDLRGVSLLGNYFLAGHRRATVRFLSHFPDTVLPELLRLHRDRHLFPPPSSQDPRVMGRRMRHCHQLLCRHFALPNDTPYYLRELHPQYYEVTPAQLLVLLGCLQRRILHTEDPSLRRLLRIFRSLPKENKELRHRLVARCLERTDDRIDQEEIDLACQDVFDRFAAFAL